MASTVESLLYEPGGVARADPGVVWGRPRGLSSRSVIDQAIGIIIGQQRRTANEAFAMLRTISQRRNIKLRVVAADLVATTSRPGGG